MLKTLQLPTVLSLVTSLVLFTSCSSRPVRTQAPQSVSIMTYNVENLFDTQHDEGKRDYTFLPKKLKETNLAFRTACEEEKEQFRREECLNTDWNEDVLKLKMKRLADSILTVNGRGPDILLVQEVENRRILERFNREYLQKAQYQTVVLLEGDDVRGIDVGVLSRLPLAEQPVLHRIQFTPDPKKSDWTAPQTRGILEVPLKLPNGDVLHAISFHWPSQANPKEERMDEIHALNRILKSKGPKALIVAGGDSNISAKEDVLYGLQSKMLASQWTVSHLVGCKDCQGTHHYRGEWSFLDILLFSSPLTNGESAYQLKKDSFEVQHGGRYQLDLDGTPARFKAKGSIGVADHLPMYGELRFIPAKAGN
jgi:endonuclease/exonuclease/phosphatase family metal-dependent hydrolase